MTIEAGERLRAAMDRKGLDQGALAEEIGKDVSVVSKILRGETPGKKHLDKFAKLLDVTKEWILSGYPRPAWLPTVITQPEESMSLVGIVQAAGSDGLVHYEEPAPTPFPLKTSWQVVLVKGMSAYPIVYPDQFVIIDTDRGARPDVMTSEQREDLHDNIVLVQLNGKKGKRPLAYLKRFCAVSDIRAPGGYVIASIDSGRSSPFISPEDILVITPVVGVIFEDPIKPRNKRFHTKTVVVKVSA